MLDLTERGLYCAPGDFYIDPWGSVERAVITHAHSDHLRWGSRRYLVALGGESLARVRVWDDRARIQTVAYGEPVMVNGVKVSLHPAGHILGSAQVRVEHQGEVWVVSGDYKTDPDATCAPFELVRCHTFITESTFGLPIYRWPPQSQVFDEINTWWRANQAAGRASVMFGYALGKSQRILAGVDPSIGPIYAHGAVERFNVLYRRQGVTLAETRYAGEAGRHEFAGALVLAPPGAGATPWMRKYGDASTAFASGWMRIRGMRRRQAMDRGFVLSDHVDWPALMQVVRETGAERVWITHGYNDAVARWLREQGLDARPIHTRFEGEQDDADVAETNDEEQAGDET